MITIKSTIDNDIEFIEHCLKDKSEEFCSQCGYGNRFFTYPVTKEQIYHFQKSVHGESYFFTIFDDNVRIGSVELMKNGSIARFLITDEYRNKGFGTQSLNILCKYAFDKLGMKSVTLCVFDFNESARRCYVKAGFNEIRRETRDNGWVAIYMEMEKMNWLDKIKQEIIEITENAAYEYWPPITGYKKPYFNHKLEHIKQVEIEALRLMETYGGDEDIVLASVWLHDRAKPQIVGADHGNRAADWVAENLASTGFPAEKVSAVEYAIRHHVGWKIVGLDTLEAKILWDADKIAHQGPSYLLDLIYLFMSEKFYGDKPYSETISLEQIMPFIEMNIRTYNEDVSKKYYFDATKKLHEEKITAMNIFIEGLIKKI